MKKKRTTRLTRVSRILDLSPHLRRIIVSGDSLKDFPTGQEGCHVKVVLPDEGEFDGKKRSYTIRFFNPETYELAMDFVVNRHLGPATNWALQAKVGSEVGIAGPGPLKLTNFEHHSYLLVGDLTSINAINGYVPRFNKSADVTAIISVPTRADIVELDYEDSANTCWFVEDEAQVPLESFVEQVARKMSKDTHVFLGLEARTIRTLRPILQESLGFSRLNTFAVGYWKKGINADKFSMQKKLMPV
ncbi:siderophore-interacting protein [Vibrio marisflavi]|uniref:Vibriobactin utilization protein ViuB n=1 Tax=Vibrio marisflavi CECT 7928 TaxID=634439 RepID=A0ABN8DY42_9VIBR|nr:siderophore-interacting protein [Vibrio marisflavi]CAH0536387.1 Vibriobactin utilization protein ViuB [Vibrio marisflavi CECT 7928]